MNMRIDYNNMMKEFIGNGFTKCELESFDTKKMVDNIFIKRENSMLTWIDLPINQDEICDDIINYVNDVKDDFDAFVVFGIGGSALGPIAVQQAINHPFYNELSREKRGGFPKFYVVDNVDPERLCYLFETIDISKTLFNVVSKSGSTSETMSQFMIIKKMLEDKIGKNVSKNIVCTTDKENGNLIKIAKEENYKTFIIPDGVGGRFSELSPVGLLPACFCGIDIKMLLEGAKDAIKPCSTNDIYKNPALMYAVLNYLSIKKGKNMCVMMPYADSLKFISDWYAQLLAESLGKKFDKNKNVVNVGQTPIKSLGVTDQHSQIQLFSEGPNDKIIVFLGVDNYKKSITIPKIYEDVPSLAFLGGVTQDNLIKTEQIATEFALLKGGKSSMTITLPKVDENTIGELLFFFESAIAFMGELLNIDAFDQPGVEEGKNATYAYFGRPGYEEKKKELDSMPKKTNDYII